MSGWMNYWGLKGDPFINADEPYAYSDQRLNSIIVETEAIKDLTEILCTPEIDTQKKVFLIGERGSGKSQCLNYIISKNLDNISTTRILPIYIPFTRLSIFNELQNIIKDENYFNKVPELFAKIDSDFFELTLKAVTADMIRFLNKNNIELKDFFNEDDFITLTKSIREATDFFMGRGKYAKTSRTPANMLASIEEVLRLLSKGFNKILLIYDEIDKAENPEIIIRFLSNNRGNFSTFVNQLNCAIVFSGRIGWKSILSGSEYSDVLGRVIELKRYNDVETYTLLRNRLDLNRAKIIPFEKPTELSFLNRENRGNPRYIQLGFRTVMQHMAKLNIQSIKDYDFKQLNLEKISSLESSITNASTLRSAYVKMERATKLDTPGYFFEIIRTTYQNKTIPIRASKRKLKELGLDMTEDNYEDYTKRLISLEILTERKDTFRLENDVKILCDEIKTIDESLELIPRIITAIGPVSRTGMVFSVKGYVLQVLRDQKDWLDIDKIMDIILVNEDVRKDAMKTYGTQSIGSLKNRMRVGVMSYLEGLETSKEVAVQTEGSAKKYIWKVYSLEEVISRKKIEKVEVIPKEMVQYVFHNAREKLDNIKELVTKSKNTLKDQIEIEKIANEFLDHDFSEGLRAILLKGEETNKHEAKNIVLDLRDTLGGYILFLIKNNSNFLIQNSDILKNYEKLLKNLQNHLIQSKLIEESDKISSSFLPQINNILSLFNFIELYNLPLDISKIRLSVDLQALPDFVTDLSKFESYKRSYEDATDQKSNNEIVRYGALLHDKELDYDFLLNLHRITVIMPTILHAFGISPDHTSLQRIINQNWKKKKYNHIILFFIDGLGYLNWNVINKFQKKSTIFSEFSNIPKVNEAIPLLSTFPSHTACAEPTLFSGIMPSNHGIVGKQFWYEADQGPIDIFSGGQMKIRQWEPIKRKFSENSLISILKNNDIKSFACLDEADPKFMENILMFKDDNYVLKGSLRDKFLKISEHISKNQKKGNKSFSFIATSEYDGKSHETGPYSTMSETRVKEIFSELDNFILQNKNILHDTLILIISDHGLTECAPHLHEVINLLQNEDLLKMVRTNPKDSILISGSRFAHIYLKNNLKPNQINDLVKKLSKEYSQIKFYIKKDIRGKGYCLGGKRCGDIIAVTGPNCVLSTPGDLTHMGFHGGPSAEEMLAMAMAIELD